MPIFFLLAILISSCDIQKTTTEPQQVGGEAKFISGKIIDEETGAAIANAIIAVGSNSAESDNNGNFDITSNLTEGTYSITATKNGYISVKRSVEIKNINEGKSFLICLSLFPKKPSVTIMANVGGTISLADGHSLQVPASSLNQNTDISITPVMGGGIPFESSDKLFIGAVNLQPDGLSFKSSAILQVPLDISPADFENPAIKAAVINATTNQWEDLTNVDINSSAGKISVPVNHFSNAAFYIGATNLRVITEPYVDSLANTTAIVDCNSDKSSAQVTVKPKIISSSLPQKILASKIGKSLSISITRTGVITRKPDNYKKQLQYQVSGTRYRFEKFSNGAWIGIAVVEYPEAINFIQKKIELCHNQGGLN